MASSMATAAPTRSMSSLCGSSLTPTSKNLDDNHSAIARLPLSSLPSRQRCMVCLCESYHKPGRNSIRTKVSSSQRQVIKNARTAASASSSSPVAREPVLTCLEHDCSLSSRHFWNKSRTSGTTIPLCVENSLLRRRPRIILTPRAAALPDDRIWITAVQAMGVALGTGGMAVLSAFVLREGLKRELEREVREAAEAEAEAARTGASPEGELEGEWGNAIDESGDDDSSGDNNEVSQLSVGRVRNRPIRND